MLPDHLSPAMVATLSGSDSPVSDSTVSDSPVSDSGGHDTHPPAAGLTRRRFLQGSAAALVIGLTLPEVARAQSGAAAVITTDAAGNEVFAPNAFVRIGEDDTVTVLIKHIEFGQGPFTGLSTLVAEELDADWSQMRAESAPADVELYANLAFGIQGTGGSTAMPNSWQQMRQAGAAARAMLVAAAAEKWNVNAAEITVAKGRIRHPSGQESGFGALAAAAAGMAVPAEPSLKDPADFSLIGTTLPKLDTAAKSTGQATFTIDLYLENMLTVVVEHAPLFGATVASFDDTAAREVRGVVDVQQIPQGVAVYAENTYAALQGRKALTVQWDDSNAETRSSAEMLATWRERSTSTGKLADTRGDMSVAAAADGQSLESEFTFPYLAHAPMEPLDGVIRTTADSVEVWMGCQMPTLDKQTIAAVLERDPGSVAITTMFAGGSFGRRAQSGSNFAAELAAVARAHGGDDVVLKLLWTREDDIRGGFYRPLVVHRLSARTDGDGNITHWRDTIVAQSIMAGGPFEQMITDGVDPTSVEGSRGLPYDIPNLEVSLHTMSSKVPVLWWRSVGHTHTAFATEVFLDELLAMTGKDPVQGRLDLLGDHPRHAGVLEAAAEMADWGSEIPDGRARGVALHKSFDSYVAEIVEVSDAGNGVPRVHKVWCAVDCGVAVNPNVIAAQMEGGIGYGLSAALFNALTLEPGGRVTQSNFHDYRSLRIDEMPDIDVRVIASTESPTGVGEPGTPPIAPAVANAWRSLKGKSVHQLPMVEVLA